MIKALTKFNLNLINKDLADFSDWINSAHLLILYERIT